jgi:GTP-binding protein YchF
MLGNKVVFGLKIGIVGPALAGKSTLFALLSGLEPGPAGKGAPPQATARVPDERLTRLAEILRPRKTVYAVIELVDFPALGSNCEIGAETAGRLKVCDALVMVIRAHRDPAVPWPSAPVKPEASFLGFLHEMILIDLCQVDSVLAKNKDRKRTPEETKLLERCREMLEETRPIFLGNWTEQEATYLRGIAFLSARPLLVAVNLDEEQLLAGYYDGKEELLASCREAGYPVVEFCGTIEKEISLLPPQEQVEFLAGYGLAESGITRLAAAVFGVLGLCTFFTLGDDEVRAWTVRAGTPARRAAGRIHSDMERGFIRAEVIAFHEFIDLGGSLKTAREQGRLRVEGKDYPIRDGEIMHVRFNV